MRAGRIGTLLVVAAVFIWVAIRVNAIWHLERGSAIAVAIVYDVAESGERPYVLRAFNRAFTEEGIPHTLVSQTGELFLLPGRELAHRFTAIVLADGINRRAPAALAERLKEYVAAGGSVVVVDDVASQDRLGHYLGRGRLVDLVGVDYVRYGALGARSYITGGVAFHDEATGPSWNVPLGKLDGTVLSSAAYGRLKYPLPAARIETAAFEANGVQVIAADGAIPIITVRHEGPSTIMFVGLPLGYLEANGDALPLRFAMRTFTRSLHPLPRLVAAPDATGALVIDFNVDSAAGRDQVSDAIARGYFRPALPFEFNVVAGPDLGRAKDQLGFDGCGKGAPQVRELERFGDVGLLSNPFQLAQAKGQSACLARETGRPVVTLAAPGTTPQALLRTVSERGMMAYSYAGDTGAPPTRGFLDARPLPGPAWAFPAMPYGRAVTFAEMQHDDRSPAEVARWLDSTAAYAVGEATIQPLTNRLDDLMRSPYGDVWAGFLNDLQAQAGNGHLQVLDMVQAARFMQKFVGTSFEFRRDGSAFVVALHNGQGLAHVGFAIPQSWLAPGPSPKDVLERGERNGFLYFSTMSEAHDLSLRFEAAKE